MKPAGQNRRFRSTDATEQAVPLGPIETAGSSFHGFRGLLALLFYREILRFMAWARAMNW